MRRQMLKKLLITGILLPFAYAMTPAQGHAGSDSALLALVRANYNADASFATAFSVDQYSVVREKHLKKTGTADIAPGNRFRVGMSTDEWVSDGSSVWAYSKPSNQVVIRRLDQVDESMLPSSVFSRYLAGGKFMVISRKAGVAQLETNGDSTAVYSSVTIWVRESTGIIERGRMIDHNGNTTTYTFASTVFGRTFHKETFQFAIPKSAHVVDMRS